MSARLLGRGLLGLCLLLTGCTPPARAGMAGEGADARFWRTDDDRVGRPDRLALRNRQDGSPRVRNADDYARFFEEIAPLLEEWSADPRLRINPNYVAALFAKESGFEPFATSFTPANGYAQLTHVADMDLRQIVADAADFQWMREEVMAWPRHPASHTPDATKARTDSLVAAGVLGPDSEYFFNTRQSTRAALFWLRILATVWLEDEWPGQHGSAARAALNGGAALAESQLFDLVTVSYNQGHPYVRELIDRYGVEWTEHLNEEASDYLERVRTYTVIFQQAASQD